VKGNGTGSPGGNGHDDNPVPAGFGFDGLDYPCRFEIKAMGLQTSQFVALVQRTIGRHVDSPDLLATSARESRQGRYLSVTVVIRATSARQLSAIYQDLSACREVLMAL
jgi:uncharacterized protein